MIEYKRIVQRLSTSVATTISDGRQFNADQEDEITTALNDGWKIDGRGISSAYSQEEDIAVLTMVIELTRETA